MNANIFNNLPEPFVGILYMLFGTITLLDALGLINAGLLVIFGSLIVLGYGFILIQGPRRIRRLVEKLQKNSD